MKTYAYKHALLLVLFCFVSFATSFASEIDIQVTQISGSSDSTFIVGDTVQLDDELSTDSATSLDMVIDQSIGVRLLPDTIAHMEQSPEGNPVLYVSQGNVLLNVLKLKSGTVFSVQTPAAVASVRGTKFWGRVLPSGVNGGNTFAVSEGSVEIELLNTGQRTLVHAGEAIDIMDDDTVLRVRPALEIELRALVAADQIATSA